MTASKINEIVWEVLQGYGGAAIGSGTPFYGLATQGHKVLDLGLLKSLGVHVSLFGVGRLSNISTLPVGFTLGLETAASEGGPWTTFWTASSPTDATTVLCRDVCSLCS